MPEKPRGYDSWLKLPPEIQERIDVADAWALDPKDRVAHLAREMERRQNLATFLMKNSRHREKFKIKCATDPVFFIENCIWTLDPESHIDPDKDSLGAQLPLLLFRFQKEHWIKNWHRALAKPRSKHCHKKTRRLRMSVTRMAFELWCWRFVPGSFRWVSTDHSDSLDRWTAWDSLFGKFRFMLQMCQRAYPWMWPEIGTHNEFNQDCLISVPPDKGFEQNVVKNTLLGLHPSEVGGRGGAASAGFIDEAGWIEFLSKFLDAIESMTPHLDLGSTAPADVNNEFWKKGDLPAYTTTVSHWLDDPVKVFGVYSTGDGKDKVLTAYPGQLRGPHTQRWRSPYYDIRASESSSQSIGRNEDIDPLATAGSKVFLNFSMESNCGSQNEDAKSYDLYDPKYPVEVWYDVGIGDPWAFLWVQIKDDIGTVDIVDYWSKADVTVHWWIPLLLGWDLKLQKHWKTAPERLLWDKVVPWPYDEPELDIIRQWHDRRSPVLQGHYRGPSIAIGDRQGVNRSPTDALSVEMRFAEYSIFAQSAGMQNKMVAFYDHADEVLNRVRISGKLVGRRPNGLPSIDEIFSYWRRVEATEGGRVAKPRHDAMSHGGSAFVYGAKWQPASIPGRLELVPGTLFRERVASPHTQGHTVAQWDDETRW